MLQVGKDDAAFCFRKSHSEVDGDIAGGNITVLLIEDKSVGGYVLLGKDVGAINRMANQLLAWIVGVPYKDFTNGFKCYRREVIEDMQPLITGQFNITIEMSLKATLAGWSYAVVPNDWRQRHAGEYSFNVLKLLKPYAAIMI